MVDDSHRPLVGTDPHDVASVSASVAEDAAVRARSAVRYGAAAYSVGVDVLESDGSEFASVDDADARSWRTARTRIYSKRR